MSVPDAMAERHTRALTELTELGLELARGLKVRAEAAPTLQEAEGLALAFHRVARSVRLTLALESKLARERWAIAGEARAQADREVWARKEQVRCAVARDVWAEREEDEAEALMEALELRLDEAGLYAGFLDGPVEACIDRLRADLGLPANDAAAPQPGEPPQAGPAAWRSSG